MVTFLVMSKNSLIRLVDFKIYYLVNWEAKNYNTNIAKKSKGIQIMRFGKFIECNMRTISLEISCAMCSGETSPRPFSKSKLSIFLDQHLNIFTVCFLLYIQAEDYQNILKLKYIYIYILKLFGFPTLHPSALWPVGLSTPQSP